MLEDDAPVPQSVQKILRKFQLEAPTEVKERQEFKTLSDKAAEIIEKCKKELGNLVSETNKLTAEYMQEEYVKNTANSSSSSPALQWFNYVSKITLKTWPRWTSFMTKQTKFWMARV